MSKTDWAWCFENPKKAAKEFDRLNAELAQLKQQNFELIERCISEEPEQKEKLAKICDFAISAIRTGGTYITECDRRVFKVCLFCFGREDKHLDSCEYVKAINSDWYKEIRGKKVMQ